MLNTSKHAFVSHSTWHWQVQSPVFCSLYFILWNDVSPTELINMCIKKYHNFYGTTVVASLLFVALLSLCIGHGGCLLIYVERTIIHPFSLQVATLHEICFLSGLWNRPIGPSYCFLKFQKLVCTTMDSVIENFTHILLILLQFIVVHNSSSAETK